MAIGISCPHCGCTESTSVTRTKDDTDAKRRYRRCVVCGKSFPTIEQIDPKKLEQIEREKTPISGKELERSKERMKKLLEKNQNK